MLSILKIQGHPRTQNILSFIIMTGDTSKQILSQQDSPLKYLLVMSYVIYTSPNALLKPVFLCVDWSKELCCQLFWYTVKHNHPQHQVPPMPLAQLTSMPCHIPHHITTQAPPHKHRSSYYWHLSLYQIQAGYKWKRRQEKHVSSLWILTQSNQCKFNFQSIASQGLNHFPPTNNQDLPRFPKDKHTK